MRIPLLSLAVLSFATSFAVAQSAPPEMARPKRPTEAQADIYSLGVLLYQMLTGTVPFQHDDPKEIVNSHLHVVPEPPRDRSPEAEIALALQRTVLKAMRKRPERRFSSMEEMSRALWRLQLQISRRDSAL